MFAVPILFQVISSLDCASLSVCFSLIIIGEKPTGFTLIL